MQEGAETAPTCTAHLVAGQAMVRYRGGMCRSIKQLRDGATPAPSEEVEAAALQFVRKISGFRQPASHNQEVFDRAVADIARISEDLLEGLEIRGVRKTA